MDYLVPRYFAGFKCKMGDCRSACCVGWPVTVSMKNYFTLLGLPCRKELRDRLDCALRVTDHPTEEEYARFSPNWLGDCPMRMEDGRCSIHAELGEDVLSDVCRLYPRGVRLWEGKRELSASNSCEKTLELLWDEAEPMTFSVRDLAVTPPPYPGSPAPAEGLPLSADFRFSLIAAMQDRGEPVTERILGLRSLLGLAAPESEGESGLDTGIRILRYYGERSDSIRDIALDAAGRYEAEPARFREDAAAFAARYQEWDRFLEQVVVNHMFFTQFPYLGIPARDAWRSLAALYGLVRLLTVGAEDKDGLIDRAAAAFRLIAHTPFERSVPAALGASDGAELLDL